MRAQAQPQEQALGHQIVRIWKIVAAEVPYVEPPAERPREEL